MNSESVAVDAPLQCVALTRHFEEGGVVLEVLRGVDLFVPAGHTVAIIGASGSGKTTLLQLLAGLDRPTSGSVSIAGRDLADLNNKERGLLRNRSLGFVYQFHHLLPEFSALENVAMPLLLRRLSMSEVRARAESLLTKVGLGDRLSHRPGELSGGERQRVAVARAMVTEPDVVLADEPTGNLDKKTGERVLQELLKLNAENGASLVIVTHDDGIARQMNQVLNLVDGVLREDS